MKIGDIVKLKSDVVRLGDEQEKTAKILSIFNDAAGVLCAALDIRINGFSLHPVNDLELVEPAEEIWLGYRWAQVHPLESATKAWKQDGDWYIELPNGRSMCINTVEAAEWFLQLLQMSKTLDHVENK